MANQRDGYPYIAGAAPEITLRKIRYAPFQKGIELGADLLEMDVQLTRDGHLVVMHDWKVDRTTDGKGFVSDLDLKQLKKLDAGIRFGEEFKGIEIPTLEEVVHWAKDKAGLTIEMKCYRYDRADEYVRKLVEICRAGGDLDRILAISFDHRLVLKIKELNRRLREELSVR